MRREDRLLTESHLVVLEVLLVANDASPRAYPSVHWDWDKLLRDADLLKGGESVCVRETMDSIAMSEVFHQRDAARAETRRLLEGEPAGDLEQAVDTLCNDASARGVRIVMGPHRTLTPDDIRRAVGLLASSRQLALEKRDAALEDAEWHRKRCEELRHQVRVQSDENLRVKLEKREDWKAACERLRAAGDAMAEALTWDQSCAYDAATTRGAIRQRIAAWSEARACVAELEAAAAPAANAGGQQQEPVAWMYKGDARFDGKIWHDRYETTKDEKVAKWKDKDAVPLYAAPQPPRGWLTADEREAVKAARNVALKECLVKLAAVLSSLLARETPPRVKVPPGIISALPHEREQQWIAAIRAAGGEVEG